MHFEFEHLIATVLISVISMKNYQISLQLNFKLNVINLKFEFNAINAPNLLSVCSEFEHFIAIVLISVISNEEIPNITATKLKLSVINLKFEFKAINALNLLSV